MPRIRTIKPETWTDTKVLQLSPLARLLFIGSWNFADDYGCLPPDATQLRLRVLPADPVDAEVMVGEFFELGLMERMMDKKGREFWHLTNWNRHQRVNRPTESDYGLPDTWRPAPTRGFSEDSVSAQGGLSEDSLGNGKEGKGREGKGIALLEDSRQRRKPELDALKDALVDVFGEPRDWSLYNRIATWIRDRGGTPDEIRRRAALIAEEWGKKAATPTSLEKHWTRYDSEVGQVTDGEVEAWSEDRERERRRAEAIVRDLARNKGLPG